MYINRRYNYTDIIYTDIIYTDIIYTDIIYTDIIYTDIIYYVSINYMGSEELCSPALLNLVLSILGYLGLIYQNLTTKSYCVGNYECDSVTKPLAFIIKFVYIIVSTWMLNILCNRGYINVAWFFVLFPFIFFILLLLFLISLVVYKQ